MFDYHVHTEFSCDCATPMARSCVAAIDAGITEIAFTDHVDHQPTDPGFGYYRTEDYFRSLDDARREFGNRLTILAGAEVDFHTDTFDAVERFIDANAARYDFIIGSVHYAANGAMIYPPLYDDRSLDDVFDPYLDEIEAAVRTGWFSTIGHIDIPKRYLPKSKRTYEPADLWERLQPVFRAMVESNVGFEINTSGIRQAPKSSMPGPAIVRWYADAGGTRITTGTDSHTERTIGAGVPLTLEMLRLCGIPNVMSFRNRVGTPVPIDRLLARSAA
ncbi:MAG: histidinol-phosphatase HisJ family protein [Thermomicrobiales bacterium]|nr:histidinol-phosphatase HisJ family protein [Thermomicrobiales bacterium]MCO5221209.1 histidinol-phosphatase HisJ family protein [Thermomicrobiales bacterium]